MLKLLSVAIGALIGAFVGSISGALIALVLGLIGELAGMPAERRAQLTAFGNGLTIVMFLAGVGLGGAIPFGMGAKPTARQQPSSRQRSEETFPVRQAIGRVLRLPVVALLGAFWILFVWWWVALGGIAITFARLLVRPLVFVPLYVCTWIHHAFTNSQKVILPSYWVGYPSEDIRIGIKSLNTGFPALHRWYVDGFA